MSTYADEYDNIVHILCSIIFH